MELNCKLYHGKDLHFRFKLPFSADLALWPKTKWWRNCWDAWAAFTCSLYRNSLKLEAFKDQAGSHFRLPFPFIHLHFSRYKLHDGLNLFPHFGRGTFNMIRMTSYTALIIVLLDWSSTSAFQKRKINLEIINQSPNSKPADFITPDRQQSDMSLLFKSPD